MSGSATAQVSIATGQSGWKQFDVTGDVQDFVSGSASNLGWVLRKQNEDSMSRAPTFDPPAAAVP